MTDRIQSLVVVLDADYRDDDAEAFVKTIRMIKGVKHVEFGPVVDNEDYLARMRVGSEYESAIWDAIQQVRKGKSSR